MPKMAKWVALMEIVLLLGAIGCQSKIGDGSDIPPVTAPPTKPEGPSATSYPKPSMPTSPSCKLLTTNEVRDALGGGEVQAPFGDVSHYSGAAGIPVDIDRCSWQQHVGADPGRVVQVEVHTAATEADALREYQEFLSAANQNTAPTATPSPVPGLGSRAALLPEWLLAQKNRAVLAVTVGPTSGGQPPDPQILRHLAKMTAARLGW
jgi:hypothetical protein